MGNKWYIAKVVALAFFLGTLSFVIYNQLKTTKIVTVQKGETAKTSSIDCSSDSIKYPFFSYDHSKKTNMNVSAIFKDDQISKINLSYILYYDDDNTATISEANNHAVMNENFSGDGLAPDSFNATYSVKENMTMNIFTEKVSHKSTKYFMIDEDQYDLLHTQSDYKNFYSEKGFSCEAR